MLNSYKNTLEIERFATHKALKHEQERLKAASIIAHNLCSYCYFTETQKLLMLNHVSDT